MSWSLVGPESCCLAGAVLYLCLSLFARPNPRRDHVVALSLAAGAVGVCLTSVGGEGLVFRDVYRIDLFSQVFKVLLSVGLFLVLTLCVELKGIEERHHSEFYLLLFLCTLALMLLASGVHLAAIYLSLELSSYCLYVLVALRGKDAGFEAGLRYFLIGISASAVTLFGIALLYAATGATDLEGIHRALSGGADTAFAAVGVLLTLGGFFFKLALFPFHSWAPDAYQGAANQVTAYIATVSKVAAVAVLLRLAAFVGGASGELPRVLGALAVISMTLGNLAAVAQKDLKRLFAYSSVAHAGYVLLGVLSMNRAGYAGAIYYAVSLLVMKFTGFLVVVKVAGDGRNLEIAQLAGLHRRSPLLALGLMVSLFSLAGLPPTIGFTGKFLVFSAAMGKGHFTLVLVAMLNVVLSLYYYLRVLRAAYLLDPPEGSALVVSPFTKVLAAALVLAMVAAGLCPGYFLEVAAKAAQTLPQHGI